MSVELRIDEINSILRSIVQYYSSKFPNIRTINYTDEDGNPASISYNATLYELAAYSNRVTSQLGGWLLSTTPPSPESTTPPSPGSAEYFYTSIRKFLSDVYLEFDIESSMQVACVAFIGEDNLRRSSKQKSRGIGALYYCKFLDTMKSTSSSILSSDYPTLQQVKNSIDSLSSYCSSRMRNISSIKGSINSLRSLYNNLCKNIGRIAQFSGSCDYITHDFYTDKDALSATMEYNPYIGRVFHAVEDSSSEIIVEESRELSIIKAMYESLSHKLNQNTAIEKFDEFNDDINSQYLSNEIEDMGYIISSILSDIMLSMPNMFNPDVELSDELTELQSILQGLYTKSLNPYNISDRATRKMNDNSIKINHNNIVDNLENSISEFQS